ncbi:flagellar biosynthesis protein FlhA [Thalassobacter stenotrophicus]|uniref:flagellar biosynthesis protein FlhA n=1 Tax=Thalassobacter stenotrophicus TaxID=266809 RepID=UPI0022A9C592|nr:flagellar biosynthesis protein FlhA [Thalassobacter stenotrophicus]UYP68142.1 flagellar biosynthesis protein FlhA [Thalassobacter stenotrophicus]
MGFISTLFKPTTLLALALMAIIVMMILPMPAWVLDIGLAASFALAILMFTVTLFIERPLDFSAFPTVLLASLMLRLSLNVSSTKLIIGEGHSGTHAAGNVIEGFANFIMGGSVFLGVVVFCVLLIVNFVVITKGATRMAEVGARFALDGMPGKQLAIDSDMSAGAIDHAEAKRRREIEQAETTFFGSLDGASKFVKGDAIAGLLITLLNLVMGLVIGTVVHGLDLGTAFETYAILTVGDGLVSQIPAVIISIASALLLARGGTTGATDAAVFAQLGRYPTALMTVGFILALFALVPGLPFIPFLLGAIGLFAAAYYGHRAAQQEEENETEPQHEDQVPETRIGDLLELDEIHVQFAPDLVSLALDPASGLEARITSMREHIAQSFGLILPEVRLTDDIGLPAGQYVIRLLGVEQAKDTLEQDSVLVLLPDENADTPAGRSVKEPVYGAPARWIPKSEEQAMALAGFTTVSPGEVLATHLLEVIKGNLPRLLGLKSLQRLLDEFTSPSNPVRASSNRRLVDDLIPDKVPMETLMAVLQMLLSERVSIRNLPLILEAIAEMRAAQAPLETICEHVRQRLGFQIVAEFRRADGTLPLIQLAPDWETVFESHQTRGEHGNIDVALPPALFSKLASGIGERVGSAAERGDFPALITSSRRRRYLHTVLRSSGLSNPVLAFEELGPDVKPAIVGLVAT